MSAGPGDPHKPAQAAAPGHDAHDHRGHAHDTHEPLAGHSHHNHGHNHGPPGEDTPLSRFAWGVALNLGFVAIEGLIGWRVDSLALLADASHNFGDVLGLLLAWGAAVLARRHATSRYTYGWRGATILAALANALLLLVAIVGIVWGAVDRLRHPVLPPGAVVIWVALAGVLINGVTAWLFVGGHKHDLNVRGAYLHMLADAGVSVAVAIAGAGMLWLGWQWLDPAISIAVAVVIFVGTWGLLRDSVALAMQAVPAGIDAEAVRAFLAGQPGVQAIHDLHIWAMSTTENAMTAHLVMPGGHPGDTFLQTVAASIGARFGIGHVTLQVEMGDNGTACALTSAH